MSDRYFYDGSPETEQCIADAMIKTATDPSTPFHIRTETGEMTMRPGDTVVHDGSGGWFVESPS